MEESSRQEIQSAVNAAIKAANHVQHDNVFYLTDIFQRTLDNLNSPNIKEEFIHSVSESLVCALAILKENKDQKSRRLFNLTSDFVLTYYYYCQGE